jgi:D-alanyl-D-alanine carboxypeptidase/D-alanyl-D-alanine-endopeptidase (penicillin-binding protein 4)
LQIAGLLNDTSVARAHWGIDVAELDGTPIYALNEGQFFQPASNAKLFTTAAVMTLLPLGHVFTTKVRGTGLFLEDGTLRGDLTIDGVGDANFAGREMVSGIEGRQAKVEAADPWVHLEELADQIAAAGIKRVEGDVIGSDVWFPWEPYPQDWTIDDALWGYGAPVSGLTVAENTLKLTISPGPKLFLPAEATLEQAAPYYSVGMGVTMVIASKGTEIGIARDMGSKVVSLTGQMTSGAKPVVEEIAIEDPAEYAALALRQMLIDRGISVTGTAKAAHDRRLTMNFRKEVNEPIANLASVSESKVFPPALMMTCNDCDMEHWGNKVLASHKSPTVMQDVILTNKNSLNLHAELMLRQLGLALGTKGTTAQGARVVRSFLTTMVGVDKDDFVLLDGSGLSGHDLVTPRATVRLLQYASGQPWFAAWKASLPAGGVDGSLENRFTKELKGKVAAKTGTLSEARALSGYLECASGRTVAFAIFVGNHAPGSTADRDVMDKIVAAIAAAN